MKKNLYILIGVFVLFSCKQEKNPGTPDPGTESAVESPQDDRYVTENEKQFIKNDSLTRAWIAELEMISTAEHQFETEEELRENRHVEKQIDTIKTLTYDESTLRIYTTIDLYALESAEIRNEELALGEVVRVGMSKDSLEQVLNTELKRDVIEVGNFTRNQVFVFYFEEERLERIDFDGYVD